MYNFRSVFVLQPIRLSVSSHEYRDKHEQPILVSAATPAAVVAATHLLLRHLLLFALPHLLLPISPLMALV